MDPTDEITKKPQSLRSLANYNQSLAQYSQSLVSSQIDETYEAELENSGGTFVNLDSDLSQIFGNILIGEDILESGHIHMNGDNDISYSSEITNLKMVVQHLQEENQQLTQNLTLAGSKNDENHRLNEEIARLNDLISNLQFDIKERDDQIKRAEQSRGMLLSKLGDSDSLKNEKLSLVSENESLKVERKELLQRLAEFEKSHESINQELQLQREDMKSYLNNVSKLKEENELKGREFILLKETSTKMKFDFDHQLGRFESESKRSEEQIRQLQMELTEKSHIENRMRSDLLAAETKATHLETENMSLRRRLADILDSRERENAQFQVKVNSLENEVSCLMDDIARMRRNQSSLDSGARYGSGYSVASTPSVSSTSSYSIPPPYQSERVPYPSSLGLSTAPPVNNSTYSISKNNLGSNADDGGYSLGDRSRSIPDSERGKHQPRSLRGVLEQDHRNPEMEAGSGTTSSNPTSLKSLVSRGKSSSTGVSPFATDITSSQMRNFDDMERQLTSLMTEKSSLEEELGRLQQRGGRTLKERTRSTQIEGRLNDLSKDISRLRRDLSSKPN